MADRSLFDHYTAWMANDWVENSRKIIDSYYKGNDADRRYLWTLLAPRIAFGTAGLRSEMLPGFAHINHVTIRQTALGISSYLQQQQGDESRRHGVIVGRDHRAMLQSGSRFNSTQKAHPRSCLDNRFSSESFAKLTVAVLRSEGFEVKYLGECHTPLVSFAVSREQAAAGIMITASHNPRTYNGLKVYWRTGCQINSPYDEGVAEAIRQNLDPPSHACVRSLEEQQIEKDLRLADTLKRKYLDTLRERASLLRCKRLDKVLVTPLHGVGANIIGETLRFLTSSTCNHFVTWVDAQKLPDPAFPTVPYPNPEEHGALDLAIQQADLEDIPTILAVDPDADRFAAAQSTEEGWHQFTGNEMGILLAVHILEKRLDWHCLSRSHRAHVAMLTTTVSTLALQTIAGVEGFYCEETLTGFKYLAPRAQELEQQGYKVVFAFEEALGYMFSDVVYDKDGVAALLEFLCAKETWKHDQDLTPLQKLHTLYERYGFFADANTYLVSASAELTNTVFENIRESQRLQGAGNRRKPAVVDGRLCRSYRDLTLGIDTTEPDGRPTLPVDPNTHMISCEIDDGRFTVRASGTEPKVKLYVESRGASRHDAQQKANELQRAVIVRPSKSNLCTTYLKYTRFPRNALTATKLFTRVWFNEAIAPMIVKCDAQEIKE
ncbi:MAG: hypothetical protein Q9162_003135 [Coniocarpon cinnabarinum]